MKTVNLHSADDGSVVYNDYIVKSGDSISSVAAKFDLTPTSLCQLNKLRSYHLFAGQRLRVVKEESESSHTKSQNIQPEERTDSPKDLKVFQKTPSLERKCKQLVKRIVGVEKPEKPVLTNALQVDKRETTDPLPAGCLRIEARFCCNLHRCIKGTLMVTRQTIMFLPADGEWQNFLPIEMRYEHIRSIAAYNDASVFVFTKRPRFSKQCSSFTGSSSDEASRSNLSTTEQAVGEGGETLEPLLQENEIFLCCSVQRNSLAPGSPVGSTICSSGAQWLIISRQRIQDLNDFLVSCNLGFATVISMEDESDNDGEGLRKKDAVEALGALIPRRMTQHFRHQDPTKARQRSYIGRSLGRLIQRTSSTKHKTAGSGTISSRRRPLSVGCSEELFSDHAAVEMVSPSNNTGDETESAVFGQSSSSTPSFADEKEVFDMLRQTSLEWELVSKQELSQRNAGGETESEADRSETTNSTQFPHLSPPNSLAQSRILSSQAQIQDLFEAIPMRVQSFDWFLTFSTEEHGFSLKTLYRRCDNFKCSDLLTSFDTDAAQTAGDFEERTAVSKMRSLSFNQENQPCVLLIRDTTDCIMGAYLSSHPHLSQGAFYGTGETFVFHWTMPDVSPCEEEILTEENAGAASKIDIPNFKKYSWSQKNSFFISSEPEALIIGCSNASPALWIDGDLHRGRSQACETFDSPQLIPGGDFCIHTVELWSLS